MPDLVDILATLLVVGIVWLLLDPHSVGYALSYTIEMFQQGAADAKAD